MLKRLPLLAAAFVGILILVLAFSWTGVLPGGWTLRGLAWGGEERANWQRETHRDLRIEQFRAERDSLPADSVVFLGSSTIERFPLHEIFPDRRCVNRGINGDTTAELLERLDDSLPSAKPAAFIINIGGNDLRREGQVAAVVRDRLTQLLDELLGRYPEASITVIGLVPAVNADEAELYELELYNLAARRAAVSRKIPFIVVQRGPLAGPDGRLNPDFAADDYHLNAAGYRRLAEWILEDGGAAGRLLAP
jgi:lysophospholipase L1-like esterase